MTSFYGWDIVRYYWFVWHNWFVGFSWQVRVAYCIVILSILAMIILGITFFFKVRKRNKKEKRQKDVNEKYYDVIKDILLNVELSGMEIKMKLNAVEDDDNEIKKNAEYFIPILVSIRTETSEVGYFPNLQQLASMLGVREYCENCLLKNKNVFNVLQMMAMMQLVITEGRLANYVNAGNNDIRSMARLCFIVCSINDPYKYLIEELDNNPSMMKLMMLHYIFAWMKTQGKRMPNFISIAKNLISDTTSAFMVKEIAYFGTEEDYKGIPTFFMSEKRDTRLASIENAYLVPEKTEGMEKLKDIYSSQPEDIKRSILTAIAREGKRRLGDEEDNKNIEFFIMAYHDFISRETKETALTCLYGYNANGRYQFEMLRQKANMEDIELMDKIDSFSVLDTIYKL